MGWNRLRALLNTLDVIYMGFLAHCKSTLIEIMLLKKNEIIQNYNQWLVFQYGGVYDTHWFCREFFISNLAIRDLMYPLWQKCHLWGLANNVERLPIYS